MGETLGANHSQLDPGMEGRGDLMQQVEELRRVIAEKDAEIAELREALYYDDLTDLPNRRGLQMYFKGRAENLDPLTPVAVISLDVNGLKEVNDNYGHEVGDNLLLNVAGVLSSAMRDSDIVARYGGDEFVMLVFFDQSQYDGLRVQPNHNTGMLVASLDSVKDRILKSLQEETKKKIQVDYSAGAALTTVGELCKCEDILRSSAMKQADEAMYENKRVNKQGRQIE